MTPAQPAFPLPWYAVATSVTRIASLEGTMVEPRAEETWGAGDYVACAIEGEVGQPYEIETVTGRMVEVVSGDLLVGALGSRAATLETVGDFRAGRGELETLTRAGIIGRVTSVAPSARSSIVPLEYAGHVLRDGRPLRMRDEAPKAPDLELTAPLIMLIGTSMSAGKTTTAIAVIRRLRRLGLRVAAAKVTGVARYRDILGMGDAGAAPVLDFVDAGLPSTICPPDEYRRVLHVLLARLAAADPEVVVVECGASPLEPYNVDLAFEALSSHLSATILCASDPYAVVGVAHAFGLTPDLVAGKATSTTAGVALVERLSGCRALNLLEPESQEALDELLVEHLGLDLHMLARRMTAGAEEENAPSRPREIPDAAPGGIDEHGTEYAEREG